MSERSGATCTCTDCGRILWIEDGPTCDDCLIKRALEDGKAPPKPRPAAAPAPTKRGSCCG